METTVRSRPRVTQGVRGVRRAAVFKTVVDRKCDRAWTSSSCSSCVVTFYWIRTGFVWWRQRQGEKKNTTPWQGRRWGEKREKKSLSTCRKAQCIVLKTVRGGIFVKWAKSRLQGIWDREMKAAGAEEMGVEEASPGKLPVIDRIPTRQDVLEIDLTQYVCFQE